MTEQNSAIEDNGPKLSVVLLQPDIPQNTGNIARLCFATGCQLILVRPLGFRLTDASLERAGMDYWKSLEPLVLDDLDEFISWSQGRNLYYLSAHGKKNYAQINFKADDVLVFGSESSGLPPELRDEKLVQERMIRLPMIAGARCLNLASSASAVVYEALRQLHGWSSSPGT